MLRASFLAQQISGLGREDSVDVAINRPLSRAAVEIRHVVTAPLVCCFVETLAVKGKGNARSLGTGKETF